MTPEYYRAARELLEACSMSDEVIRVPIHDARAVRSIREAAGLNEVHLAEILGVPVSRVEGLERGDRPSRHENRHLDLIRRRTVEKGSGAKLFFLKVRAIAYQQSSSRATIALELGWVP